MKNKNAIFHFKAFLGAICFWGLCLPSFAQLIVNNKDVNADKSIEYIQFMFFINRGTLRPEYLIDYGTVDLQKVLPKDQKVKINNVELDNRMTPVLVLNMLYKAKWEYTGDGMYAAIPAEENWFIYTLKRRKD